MDCSEKGLKKLLKTDFRKDAYTKFFEGDIQGQIFVRCVCALRYSDEHGLVGDIFYQNMGLGEGYAEIFNQNYSKYILKL
ncbi:hypothetical protein B9T31_13035 [Acinetobacter sp. ANC 4558]|nr:hypothetical protein B9T31_13035 [Acinetobacter sp. ANC 4558]